MILDIKIKIKITKLNINHYSNFFKVNLGDIIEVDVEKHLQKGSNLKINVQCDLCLKNAYLKYQSYIKNINSCKSNMIYTCVKCSKIKTKITNLERYGVEFNLSLEKNKEMVKKTCLDRYGVENPLQSKIIKDKIKKTNLNRYGVENPFQSEIIKDKIKKTNLNRYGVENPFQSEIIKDKIKDTNLNKYGVEYYSQTDEFNEKVKNTSLERYGVEHPMNLQEIKDKIKETNLNRYGVDNYRKTSEYTEKIKLASLLRYGVEHYAKSDIYKRILRNSIMYKYGVEYYSQTDEFNKKVKNTSLERYGVDNYTKSIEYGWLFTEIRNDINFLEYINNSISLFKCNEGHNFELKSDNYYHRVKNNIPLCTVCNPIGDLKSIKEKNLLEFIRYNYNGEIISGYRDALEIDIYLPELNIGFEFNGLYYHSEKFKEKNYHLDKTNYFKERGIRIIHIWEDDWDYKQGIIKSQILNLLGKSEKVYARQCFVKELTTVTDFLNVNHTQGVDKSVIKLGLFFNNELVSVMTFNKLEGRKKMKDGYNLSRFCNRIGYNVVGGASKLLKFFLNKYHALRIISYADKDWSVGSLYHRLSFKNINESKPDYKYLVNGKRKHKQNFIKKNLRIKDLNITESKYMQEKGIYKIYDCGKIKFELKIENGNK